MSLDGKQESKKVRKINILVENGYLEYILKCLKKVNCLLMFVNVGKELDFLDETRKIRVH